MYTEGGIHTFTEISLVLEPVRVCWTCPHTVSGGGGGGGRWGGLNHTLHVQCNKAVTYSAAAYEVK